MPFPAIFLWGAAAAVAAVGVKKGLDAKEDFSKAKEIGERAEREYNRAQSSLDSNRKRTQKSLEELGELKVRVFSNQIKHLVSMHEKFHSKISGYDQDVLIENLKDVKVIVAKSLEIEKGLGTGAVAGGLSAIGAYGAVGTLATASTGTAIGTLSGAAATNATLAWLGGGALSAGGFGMAGGAVALGGIVLAPALAIGGFWVASKAEKALTDALKYEADVDKARAQMQGVETILAGIRASASEMFSVIVETAKRFDRVKVYDMEDREKFMQMLAIGKGLKQILNIPVMLKDGTANPNVRLQCRGFLKI